ncbi:MAG: helix-turn-helix domain-containing protein [Candidatus Devosia phytovorans]|uniref:Helix-turn-helix domain-containing protein n=1 Tax=Candidatus Devosia phytovorans TaxID=3121372 RepID=A0AAJ5VQM2_9HYPH|nr:helix-turn-helix domain-containing protein [Devosia sp.]WEK02819.1 MAG: helix-turn-helix domain-containing protein [Devosia sp.]
MHHTPSTTLSRRARAWRRLSKYRCDDVIALVARTKHVSIYDLVGRSRGPTTSRARQIAMYLCHVILSRSLSEVGTAFGRDRTTVSYACALIEDLRDDVVFDRDLCLLEDILEARLHVA